MAYITEFTVRGLAGSDHTLRCDLDRHLNVFFGPNGTGKTSLLRILFAAIRRNTTSLHRVPFDEASVSVYSEAYDTVFTHFVAKKDLRAIRSKSANKTARWLADKNPAHSTGWIIDPPLPDSAGSGWAGDFLPTSRLCTSGNTLASSRIHEHPTAEDDFDELLIRRWQRYFSSIQADIRSEQQQGLAKILTEVIAPEESNSHKHDSTGWEEAFLLTQSFLTGQNLPIHAPSMDRFEHRFKSSPLLRRVVSIIEQIQRETELLAEPKTKIQGLITRLVSGPKSVEFTTDEIRVFSSRDEPIKLSSLSSGEQQLLRIAVAALSIGSSSLLIDEPELSMHIDWQRHLLDELNSLNPDMQLIAASHSPEIMAFVPSMNIIRIS